ncbi:protein-tyrosine phosphatase family protein [Yersinia aleksiciae]|uniref:Tyrosine phosphatase n=1 Tax=Yersinia aleksiciae TaxID=263819 RepID=A0A0T9UGZ7_YERAE|nr:protein-tyrosine phosphatase family protein [Yersinia aleksiciae]CNL41632.1 tyrosine phosphatase [Yersinia aleksiciae]
MTSISHTIAKAIDEITFQTLTEKKDGDLLTTKIKDRTYIVSTTPEGTISVKHQESTQWQMFDDPLGRMFRFMRGESRASLLQQAIVQNIEKNPQLVLTTELLECINENKLGNSKKLNKLERLKKLEKLDKSGMLDKLDNLSLSDKILISDPKFQKNFVELHNTLQANQAKQAPKGLSDTAFLPPNIGKFINIRARIKTSLDPQLNANKITLSENNTIHAGSHPKDEQQVATLLKMLMGDAPNKKEPTSCLVVLNNDDDLIKRNLIPYFKPDKPKIDLSKYNIKTEVTREKSSKDGIERYQLTIINTKTKKEVKIPVIRVPNWVDHSVIDNKQLENLVKIIEKYAKSEGVPFVHCNAGAGRTAVLIAIRHMLLNPTDGKSVESIVTTMREQRNEHMVQTPRQLLMVALLAKKQGRPLLKRDERLPGPQLDKPIDKKVTDDPIYENVFDRSIYANALISHKILPPPLPPKKQKTTMPSSPGSTTETEKNKPLNSELKNKIQERVKNKNLSSWS